MKFNYFFTADEHYDHVKIIDYCHRPFEDVKEMNTEIIRKHNLVVGVNDTVIHAGDFYWGKKEKSQKIIKQLNGNHIFLQGSHDHWLSDSAKDMWRKMINNHFIVVCHYCLRTWERSHYNSWHLFGHSHGRLDPIGKSVDIGVDNHNFIPWSFEEIREYMKNRPDNPNFIKY